MVATSRAHTFDALMNVKNSSAVTATAVAQIGGVDTVLDLGANSRADLVLAGNISALDETSGNETYSLQVQGCNDSAFGSAVQELTLKTFDATGPFEMFFTNEKSVDGVMTKFRYIRVRHVVAGTTPSITYHAYVAPARP
jgi:hypothetical protein